MVEAAVVTGVVQHAGAAGPERGGTAAVQIERIGEPDHLREFRELGNGHSPGIAFGSAVHHHQPHIALGICADKGARVTGVEESLPAGSAFRIGVHLPVIDEDGTAGHRLPGAVLQPRGIAGLDADPVRPGQEYSVGPGGLLHRRSSNSEAVILHIGDRRELPHIEVASVDAGQRAEAGAEGAGTVGPLPFRTEDIERIGLRAYPDEGDSLRRAEKLRLPLPVNAGSLRHLPGRQDASRHQIVDFRNLRQERMLLGGAGYPEEHKRQKQQNAI